MIRAAAILATAASVLWHAVGGCCTHHAADECAHGAPPAHGETCADHAADADGDSHSDCDESHDDEGPSAPCDGPQCTFTVGKVSTPSDLIFRQSAVAYGYSFDARIVAADAVSPRLEAPDDDRPPAMRAHLALGVLRI